MSDSESETLDLFQEPEGYFQPEKQPTTVQHRTLQGQSLTLHLVGSSPLWGHLLWNAGRTVANYLEQNHVQLVASKTVLELGAGAGLPSLICAMNGAARVAVTDYPDSDLIATLERNIRECSFLPTPRNIVAEGYLWGADPAPVLAHLPIGSSPSSQQLLGFDLLILADLLFNHSEHGKLLSSVRHLLRRDSQAQALVFFTPYRPWLLQKDLAFFDLAQDEFIGGFEVEKIMETVMEKVMFDDDPGDELLRRTVYGYRLRWTQKTLQSQSQ